jgi:hypothetical protein
MSPPSALHFAWNRDGIETDKTGEDWIANSPRPDPSVLSGRKHALRQADVGILSDKPSNRAEKLLR